MLKKKTCNANFGLGTRNMIDYVLTGKGALFVKNCRAYPGNERDIGS